MKPMGQSGTMMESNGTDLPQPATQMGTISPLPGTHSPQAARTRQIARSLPLGVVIGKWKDGRRKPYYVRFGEARVLESYQDEEVRNDRAEEIRDGMKRNGRDAYAFDPDDWREYAAFRQRVKATLPQLEEAWLKHSKTTSGGLTVPEVVALYKAKRKTAGRSKDGLKHRDLALGRFEAFVGNQPTATVSDATISKWFDHLRKEHGLGDVAVAGHFSALRAMFNLPSVKKVCRENPCDFVEPPHVEESDEVAVLSLRQAFDFFKANREQVAIGRLAAEAFAGLRFSSAAKLRLEDLDFAELGITLPASRHKSNRRHYVDRFTRNLWLWLKFAPAECWALNERNYMRHKSQAFDWARFENPGNVFRHTMPTMHLSAFKNAAALATLLQHRNATMLYQRYKGRGVSQAVARAYFMITPKTVLSSFERFCRLANVPAPTP